MAKEITTPPQYGVSVEHPRTSLPADTHPLLPLPRALLPLWGGCGAALAALALRRGWIRVGEGGMGGGGDGFEWICLDM